MANPRIILIGKPIEKGLICGAARDKIPNERFTIINDPMAGKATSTAAAYIQLAWATTSLKLV
jgi:hypothetical protein